MGMVAMSRKLSIFEEPMMRALRLENISQLDSLLAQPISQDAALHSEPPDESYDLADQMYAEVDRQRDAQQRFDSLVPAGTSIERHPTIESFTHKRSPSAVQAQKQGN
jgi:hypothetical protein